MNRSIEGRAFSGSRANPAGSKKTENVGLRLGMGL
jgi:hypothetical protein